MDPWRRYIHKRFLLFPIHLNVHWCLAVVDLAEQSISYYDSLKKANPVCLNVIYTYLVQHLSNCLVNWKLVHNSDIPEQINSSDSGVFVCMYARFLSYGSPFSFSQLEMSSIRWHVALELFLKKLLHQLAKYILLTYIVLLLYHSAFTGHGLYIYIT